MMSPSPSRVCFIHCHSWVQALIYHLQTKGLSEWTLSAWKLSSGQVDEQISVEADLLKAYLRGSPEAIELLSLLGVCVLAISAIKNIYVFDYGQTTMSMAKESLVIEALTQTLICTKKLNLRAIGTGIIRSLLRSHMKPIYRRLSSVQSGGGAPTEDIQAALLLLSTIANHGSAAAHELQGCFNFGLKVFI